MKLILIRHAEPDYDRDSLTPKGFREAECLAGRAKEWEIDALYVSPLGRARRTAEPIERALGRKAAVLDWLREFRGVIGEEYGTEGLAWDFPPKFWTGIDGLYDKDVWYDTQVMAKCGDAPGVKEVYLETCRELDALLASYGCHREKNYYRTDTDAGKDKTVALVCHMGISFAMISHLLGIAFPALMGGFFLPPSSVTVLGTEEMEPGIAYFRCQGLGDVWHLRRNGEPISASGYFTEIFQK